MLLSELIERLRDIQVEFEDYGFGDPEVRIAYQPGYPMEEQATGVTTSLEAELHGYEETEVDAVVWIGGSGSNEYLAGAVAQELWR